MIKEYLEIKVIVPEEIADQISNYLVESGSQGVWINPHSENLAITGYLSDKSKPKDIKTSIIRYLDELRSLGFKTGKNRIEIRKIKQKDWFKDWKKKFETIFVDKDIVIIPDWDQSSYPDKTVIRIKPGMAFGTGAHPTTQLCLRALKKYLGSGKRVIDVGCGSGILSILSVKLGASYILGLDIDQDAIENAEENLALNQVGNLIEIKQGTVTASSPDEPFDMAVANLTKNEIFESFTNIQTQVKSTGMLIFSGILEEEEGETRDFLEKQNIQILEITRQEEWICFNCRGNSPPVAGCST
ncbi:MAG TPA: 50S ribosomal protein L11 methyltransferase [candidate division Zixibacteria bacterium]